VVTLTKIEIVKRRVEERRRAIEGIVEEALKEGRASDRERAFYVFVPKNLTKNVVLDVIEAGKVVVILHGDDLFDEGMIKRVELRLKDGALLSEFKRWLAEEGILKALQYALAANKAAPPPKTKREEEDYIRFREELAILKHLLGGRP
jgi:hypothetical protein